MPLKFIYSQLSSESLIPLINAHYPNITPVSCKFYARGLHDNYLIESNTEKYILRIYRSEWRSTDEILNEITLFDFDQCGYGYRAFELGKFLSAMYPLKEKSSCMEAFMKGYQSIRKLSEAELQAIPYFEIVSIIWVLTIYVDNADRIGYRLLDKPFWRRRINILKELEGSLDR